MFQTGLRGCWLSPSLPSFGKGFNFSVQKYLSYFLQFQRNTEAMLSSSLKKKKNQNKNQPRTKVLVSLEGEVKGQDP